MKKVVYLFFFICVSVASQNHNNLQTVDAVLGMYPKRFNSPYELSKLITRDFKTNEEKVRAIYSWIIQNIAYNPEEYKRFNYQFTNFRERNKKEEETREKIINQTLKTGQAVCEGYSFLFEKLCALQGIQNYVVRGDTKAGFNDIGRIFKTNHTWNVAYVNGKPYLFDPTWGAGRYTDRFVKDTSYFYYKIPPEQLIKSHYPIKFEDAFLKHTIGKEEFFKMPLIIDKKIGVSDLVNPKTGILYSDEYVNQIVFKLKKVKPETIAYSFNGNSPTLVEFDLSKEGLQFSIKIGKAKGNLLIYFDGKPALGYKVK